MSVTREQLYQQVWAEPISTVATHHGVSGSYLARVCAYLNVPHPPRGYWAKLAVGKAPKQPGLPPARAGEVLEWSRGDFIPKPTPWTHQPAVKADRQPHGHPLVNDVQVHFEKARFSDVGYLRPYKRNLVDICVSQPALVHALNTTKHLFLALEKRGWRVTLSDHHCHRPELLIYPGQKSDYYGSPEWTPNRPTVVFVEDLAFGLTIYEMTELVEVDYKWDAPVRYTRLTDAQRRPRWSSDPVKRQMPSGRLGVRTYFTDWRVKWEQHWTEKTPGGLVRKFGAVANVLQSSVADLRAQRDAANVRDELERQRLRAEHALYEQREAEKLRLEAIKQSHEELLNIVEAWTLARNLETFFDDLAQRASRLPPPEQAALMARLGEAKSLLGSVDTLERFGAWRGPDERLKRP